MTEPWDRLRLALVDDEIIVSLPGPSYSITSCQIRLIKRSFGLNVSR
jgi:hypothetical protein